MEPGPAHGEEIADHLREAAPRPAEGAPPTTTEAPSTPAAAVRPVQTYEHPTLLTEALETSEKRLLLISPWLRRGVINDAFLAKLKAALERGVVVYLGWGMSASETDSPDADSGLVKELDEFAKAYGGFRFERLGRTHAKVLVCDSRFVVVTSFNWLSFRGDPKRTFRDERGTLVSIPEYVDGQFAEWRSRFGE